MSKSLGGSSKSRRRFGLRQRLGLALGALILAVALGAGLALGAYAREAFAKSAQEAVDAAAQQAARELSFGLDRFAREIQLQARNPIFRDPASSAALARGALEEVQKVHPEFAHISVVDMGTDRVLFATGGIFEGGVATGRPVFEGGKKGMFVADVHDAVKLAALLPGGRDGEPLRFLDVAAPIQDATGRAFRVLAAHLSWAWADAVKAQVLRPMEAAKGVQLLVVSTSGAVISPPTPDVKMGASLADLRGADPKRWADGRQYVWAEARTFASGASPGLGWRVVARQPLDAALARADRLRDYALLGAAALGLLAATLAWLLADRIVRPVAELARAAERMEPGAALPPAVAESSLPEVAAMRGAINRVAREALGRAERLLAELASIYEGAPVGLCVVDSDLRYARVNSVWAQAFHVARAGAPEAMRAPEAPAALLAAARNALGGAPSTVEVELNGSAPLSAWQVAFAPVRDPGGAIVGASAVATDVTEIRRAEQELRALDRRKTQFVSVVAHELRNPLSPIVSALGILERSDDPERSERARRAMREQVRVITRLVDDLADMSRSNQGRLDLAIEPIDAAEVCEAAADSARPQFEQREQSLKVAVDQGLPKILADRVRLTQMLCNLLINSSKYGRRGGKASLSARADGSFAVLTVEDDGVGISEEFLPHVFEMFSQARAEHSLGGLGIGLALVKSLAEQHGGSVEARSAGEGCGSVFTLRIPLAREGAADASSARPSARA